MFSSEGCSSKEVYHHTYVYLIARATEETTL